ncbi:abhydrolase domain containing 18 domain-containing protein [Ditylenchus destructor]|uniref:Abhydrolase domain containing 18 domain-containing protein n=1 Tax=Ditylenchus destructor TaxID=166010 RepID=A0AAD4MSR7_9BILA|nr:abhydrolase domain containing 18 domain-containing protein [Ditylenchus destructor]
MKYFRDNYMTKGAVMELIERKMPKMVISDEKIDKEIVRMQGYFISPLAEYAPELFEQRNVTVATWLGIFPKKNSPGTNRPLIVNLAATGDHSYIWRQTSMANRLAEEGVSTILLENPFYGTRKPKGKISHLYKNI